MASTVSINDLPDFIQEKVFLNLHIKDVLVCTQVCSQWKDAIENNVFWKRFIGKWFDITASDELLSQSVLNDWRDPDEFFPYFTDEGAPNCWVFKLYPVVWGCGVAAPRDFSPNETGNSKSVAVALSKLAVMSKGISKFDCFATAGATEVNGTLQTILMPWDKECMPNPEDLQNLLHINPEVMHHASMKGYWQFTGALLRGTFGMRNLIGLPTDGDYDDDEEEDDENEEGEECSRDDAGDDEQALHKVPSKKTSLKKEKRYFQQWLSKILRTSNTYFIGGDLMNPVIYFHLTKLSPGIIGGIISGLTFT